MEAIIHIDHQILYFINDTLANPFFDWLLPIWRNKFTWIPLYIALLIWFIASFRKKSWLPIVFTLLTVGICDFTSSSIIKPNVGRLRPCNNPEVVTHIHVRVDCGPGKSFPSSHACNHFGIAVFIIALFWEKHRKWLLPVGVFWAGLVSYAQVYVGVHFPIDVTVGAMLGTSIALGMSFIYRKLAARI